MEKRITTKVFYDADGNFQKRWLVSTRRSITKRDYHKLMGGRIENIDSREIRSGRRLSQPCWTNVPYWDGHFHFS